MMRMSQYTPIGNPVIIANNAITHETVYKTDPGPGKLITKPFTKLIANCKQNRYTQSKNCKQSLWYLYKNCKQNMQ